MKTVLVTAAGGTLAPLNIRLMRESRRHDVRVVAVDTRADAAGCHFANAFAVVPPGTHTEYPETIAALVERHGVDMVLPWSDEEALALAARRERLEAAGALLACAELPALRTMGDKAASLDLLAGHGVRVPDWTLAESTEELSDILSTRRTAALETVVKPVHSRGGRDVHVIRDDIRGRIDYHGSREIHVDWPTFVRDHRLRLDGLLPVMVMERLTAPALDIDMLAWQGHCLQAVARERVNPSGIPFRGCLFRNTPALSDIAARIAAALNLSWLHDIDLMSDAQGAPVVIELNPRPSGSIAASIQAGVPFYEMLLDLADSRLPEPAAMPPDGQAVVPYMACHVVKDPS